MYIYVYVVYFVFYGFAGIQSEIYCTLNFLHKYIFNILKKLVGVDW